MAFNSTNCYPTQRWQSERWPNQNACQKIVASKLRLLTRILWITRSYLMQFQISYAYSICHCRVDYWFLFHFIIHLFIFIYLSIFLLGCVCVCVCVGGGGGGRGWRGCKNPISCISNFLRLMDDMVYVAQKCGSENSTDLLYEPTQILILSRCILVDHWTAMSYCVTYCINHREAVYYYKK